MAGAKEPRWRAKNQTATAVRCAEKGFSKSRLRSAHRLAERLLGGLGLPVAARLAQRDEQPFEKVGIPGARRHVQRGQPLQRAVGRRARAGFQNLRVGKGGKRSEPSGMGIGREGARPRWRRAVDWGEGGEEGSQLAQPAWAGKVFSIAAWRLSAVLHPSETGGQACAAGTRRHPTQRGRPDPQLTSSALPTSPPRVALSRAAP